MDDSRHSTPSFADDFDEFDNLLDDEPAAATATMSARTGRTGRMPAVHDVPTQKAAKGSRSLRISPDWNRIAAALFVGAIVLLVLFFVVSSIRDSRRNGGYKEYFTGVREIATQSSAQGEELDTILKDPNGGDRAQRIARVEQLAARADKLTKQSRSLDTPEQLATSQVWLDASLEYRANGIHSLGRALTTALDSKDTEASTKAISAAMSRLIASDAIWADSFVGESKSVLNADEVSDITVPNSSFVTDSEATSAKTIQAMLTRLKTSGKTTAAGKVDVPNDGKIRGGQLEGGRVTVSPSGQTLALNQLTEIKGGEAIKFEVPFTNQGQVQLTEVPVKVVLRSDESDPIELSALISKVDPGETATAQVSLDTMPTFGEVLDMDILVGPIPGEKTTENNRASFQVQFSID